MVGLHARKWNVEMKEKEIVILRDGVNTAHAEIARLRSEISTTESVAVDAVKEIGKRAEKMIEGKRRGE